MYVGGVGLGTGTLGSGKGGALCVEVSGGCTLGDVGGGAQLSCCGIGCMRLSCVARVNNAFRTGSPASKLGVVVEGGSVKRDIISPAA